MAISLKARSVRLFVLFGFLGAASIASAAPSTCARNFKNYALPDGHQIYTTTSTYQKFDVHEVLEDYAKIVEAGGYTVIAKPDYNGSAPMLGIGRPPSPLALAISTDAKQASIAVTAIVAPGQKADPLELRNEMCVLVAKFDQSKPALLRMEYAQQTPEEAEKAARPTLDESRTTIAEKAPASIKLLEPGTSFDLAATKSALEPGNSIIAGQACGGYKGTLVLASHKKVYIYPASPYWEELVKLQHRAKPGKERVMPDPAALTTRMEATTDDKGRFQFSRMKPGRYYLVTSIFAVLGESHDVRIGSVSGEFGSADVYKTENSSYDGGQELTKFVDVKSDGDTVNLTMQPPISANPLHRGLRGSVLGCHRF